MYTAQNIAPHMAETEKGLMLAPENGREFDITTSEWSQWSSARFGQDRPSSIGTKWTGDAFRYDIFCKEIFKNNMLYALRWQNGSGSGWLVSPEHSGKTNILKFIGGLDSEETRWDLCHALWETAQKTRSAASNLIATEFKHAIIENRVKKCRKRKHENARIAVVSGNLTKYY